MGKQSLPSSLRPAPERLELVHSHILQWYAVERRDLPWRSTDDPYAILVSEIMLQQTQVERVLPKYQQFLAAFPTVADLAAAPTADVISIWSPLGYNMRAVRLQSIARQVMAEYGGRVPHQIEEIFKLKSVRRYTAGAVAFFSYKQQDSTVCTNIYPVPQRIFLTLSNAATKL